MIAEEIHRITEALPASVRLVAVSKYHPSEAIREAYAAGQRLFGESHAQELQRKHLELADIEPEWHFIGHLQTNKVKYLEINRQALKVNRIIPCLLQLHVAQEKTKFGFTPDEARAYLEGGLWRELKGVSLVGAMAMASNTDDTARIRRDFHEARQFFEEARRDFLPTFTELSMGMSDDWRIAVDEGSTLIRIGTQIFGQRQY